MCAVHLPLYPFEFMNNDAYHKICEDFKSGITSWHDFSLYSKYGRAQVDALKDDEFKLFFLDERDDAIRPDFTVRSTPTALILLHTSTKIREFDELKDLLTDSAKEYKLKSWITFLCNMDLLQAFNSPSSSQTYIAQERQVQFEDDINELYLFCDDLEPRFQYQLDTFQPDPKLLQKLQSI